MQDVLGDICFFETQNELNKKKKKQENEVTKNDIIKHQKTKIEIIKSYPEYDMNGINNNITKLSTNLCYNYTRKRVYIKDIYKNYSKMNNNEIKVSGWIENVKETEDKNCINVVINDGSYYDYLTLNINNNIITKDIKMKIDSTIEVKGIIMKLTDEKYISMNVSEIVSMNENSKDLAVNKDDVNIIQSVYHLRPRNKMVYIIIMCYIYLIVWKYYKNKK